MRRTRGYKPHMDVVLESIGEVNLKDNSKLMVEIRKYVDLPPRVSIIHEFHDYDGPHKEARVPRLTAKAALDLSELLATAADALQELDNSESIETP